MNELINKAVSWIEKFKQTTILVKDLPSDIKLQNGWGKRELCIHLMGWDLELLRFAEELRKGNPFHYFFESKENEYNKKFFDDYKKLNPLEAEEKFTRTREKMIETYEEIVEKYPQNNKEFVGFFSLWWHDTHHLKQAGANIEELRE